MKEFLTTACAFVFGAMIWMFFGASTLWFAQFRGYVDTYTEIPQEKVQILADIGEMPAKFKSHNPPPVKKKSPSYSMKESDSRLARR